MNLKDAKEKLKKLKLEAQRKLNHPTTAKTFAALGEASRRAIHLTAETSAFGKIGIVGSGLAAFVGTNPSLAIHYPDYENSQFNQFVTEFAFHHLNERGFLVEDLNVTDEATYYLKGDPEKTIIFNAFLEGPVPSPRQILQKGYKDPMAVVRRLGDAMWSASESKRLSFDKIEGRWQLIEDPLDDAAASELADTIEADVKAFNDAGYHRSELLFGPPGTGKSYIARRVAQQRGDRSVRASFTYDAARALLVIAKFLRPRTVIMDDICRGNGDLDMVEGLRKYAELTIATANYTNRLDPAVQRPGRFDSMRLVKKLDDDAIKRMLPELELEIAREIAELPAAYIEEFRVTKEVHGIEAAVARMEELKTRSKRLEKQIEDDAKPVHAVQVEDNDA